MCPTTNILDNNLEKEASKCGWENCNKTICREIDFDFPDNKKFTANFCQTHYIYILEKPAIYVLDLIFGNKIHGRWI